VGLGWDKTPTFAEPDNLGNLGIVSSVGRNAGPAPSKCRRSSDMVQKTGIVRTVPVFHFQNNPAPTRVGIACRISSFESNLTALD